MSNGARETIQRFHERYPGSSFRNFSRILAADRRNSYEILVDAALTGLHAPVVLDLGCGDGSVLATVAARETDAGLFGIDLSEKELEVARRRLPAATFVRRDVLERFPFEEKQFDVVLSHLVLMLVGDLDPLIPEVTRVLKPGGRFAFVVDGTRRSGSCRAYFDAVRAAMTQLHMEIPESFTTLADRRLYDPVSLAELLGQHGLILRTHRDFSTSVPAEEEFVIRLVLESYPLGLLDDASIERAANAIRAWYRETDRTFDLSSQLYVFERST